MPLKWTEDMDSTIMELWGKIKAEDIGKKLGASKGAVIGRHRRLLEKAKLIVHPAFDHKTGVWFVDEFNVEAKTIQGLLKKLPKGSSIKDYRKIV